MQNWKLVVGVIGGSLLLLVLITLGLSNLQPTTSSDRVAGVEGESRLVTGNPDGKVVVVEFSDFQCPACAAAQPLVSRIVESYQEVKLVYRHMPLYGLHPNAELAALASEAANGQGKFKEYHDWLFANQNTWSGEDDPLMMFVGAAEQMGLDKSIFETELKEKKYQDVVDADVSSALGFGVNSTPTFFVNGIKATSASLETTIKAELSK